MVAEIACDMSALTPQEREAHAAARESWAAAATRRRELEGGVEFHLPAAPETLSALAEFVGYERRCCPFFTFDIRVDGGPDLVFRMTGPPGAAPILEAL